MCRHTSALVLRFCRRCGGFARVIARDKVSSDGDEQHDHHTKSDAKNGHPHALASLGAVRSNRSRWCRLQQDLKPNQNCQKVMLKSDA